MSTPKYKALVKKLNDAANKMEASNRKKKGGAAPYRSRRPARQVFTQSGPVLENHWRMLSDPCFANLAESAYRGRSGIVSRFTGVNTFTAGSFTAAAFVYNPAALSATQFAVATSSTSATPSYDQPMPGQAYLLATAESYRVIGFCLDIDYVGTELNRSGMVYGGVVPSSTVIAGVATNVDKLKVLLSNSVRTPDREITQLWFPGVNNEQYNDIISATIYGDANNSLILCVENMPTGLQIRIRQTVIYEWLPKADTGIIMPSPIAGTNPTAAYERLFERAKAAEGFVHSFKEGAAGVGRRFAYASGQAAATAVGGALYGRMRARDRVITFQNP